MEKKSRVENLICLATSWEIPQMRTKMKDFVVEVFMDVLVLWKTFPMVLISPQSDIGARSYEFLKINQKI